MAEDNKLSLDDGWGGGPSPIELKAATEVTQAFLMAVKNYGIFPPEHASTINMLRGLCANLNSFINRYGPLRLDIERGRLRFEDEIVYEEFDPENNPAYVFFRDGILWLEFQEGLEAHEILLLFRTVNRYKLLQEEPEGDLVTELWSADLPHINYGVSENLWEAEPILEFSLLNPASQTFLEQGAGADQPGFDLLKSLLGLAPQATGSTGREPVADVAGGGGFETDGAARTGDTGGGSAETVGTGGKDEKIPGGTGTGGGSVKGGAGPDGDSGAAMALAGKGIGNGSDSGGGAGSLQKPIMGGSKPAAAAEAKELDFWETLELVNPGRKSGSGSSGSAAKPGSVGRAVNSDTVATVPTASGSESGSGGPAGSGSGGRVAAGTGGHPAGKGKPRKTLTRRRRTGEVLKGSNEPPVSDAATRKATAFSRPGRGGDWGDEDQSGGGKYISVNVASIEPGHSLWNFSDEEQRTLQAMVRDYEEVDNSADIVEILLILLKLEDESQIVIAMVGFLREEFRISLANRNFKVAHDLLVEIDMLRWQPGLVRDWVVPFLDKFMEDISEPEVLDALAPLWAELPSLEPEVLKSFAAILRLLPPKSGEALVSMSAQVESGKGRRILIDLIASFANRDLDIIEKMLNRPEEDLTLRLIGVLRAVTDRERAEKLLFKAITHPKEKVRKEVCDILLDRESERYDKLFLLIHDPSPAIRARIFAYLGRARNRRVEQLFLVHLASDRFLAQNHEHINQCYLTLGCCGSDESLPLLKKILFSQPWNFMVGLGQSIHRQGAAMALSKIRTPASLKLLAGAESSSIPNVRKAWFKATGN